MDLHLRHRCGRRDRSHNIPFSTTDNPGAIADAIATTIDSYAVASGDSTFVITAQALTYIESTDIVTGEEMPATVALTGFTATQLFSFTPFNSGLTPGLDMVGAPGVKAGSIRVPFTAADSPELIAQEMVAAINGAGFTATAAGQLVTIKTPGVVIGGLISIQARIPARLVIDPGVVVKMLGSRIETQMGAELIAEGTASNPVIFTSIEDDRYGGGGTFDTTNDGFDTTVTNTPQPGDWGGLYFAPASLGSIDHAVIAYGGGTTTIEGGFASFNAVEIYQATVRLADSTLEYNADGTGADTAADGERNGREDNGSATVFVRGAQPVIANNLFEDNDTNRGGAFSARPGHQHRRRFAQFHLGARLGPFHRAAARPTASMTATSARWCGETRSPTTASTACWSAAACSRRNPSGTTPTSFTSWRAKSACPISTSTAACGWKAATRPAW